MNPKETQARHLYFAQAKTQKEIALILDVSERPMYNWIKRHSWDQLRQASHQAPTLISENLCSQLVELQNSIARREPGLRYATDEESRIMMRLINMLEKMKKFPSLSTNMQVMATFSNWMSTRDKDFTRNLSVYSNLFLEGYAKNGYRPYDLEFGIEKISPVDPFYEVEPILSKSKDEEPKPNNNVILSLSKDEEKNQNQQPEVQPSEPSQEIDNQPLHPGVSAVQPEKTGNNSATTPTENELY